MFSYFILIEYTVKIYIYICIFFLYFLRFSCIFEICKYN